MLRLSVLSLLLLIEAYDVYAATVEDESVSIYASNHYLTTMLDTEQNHDNTAQNTVYLISDESYETFEDALKPDIGNNLDIDFDKDTEN